VIGRAVPNLLDVNVLVALFDPDHVHHEAAHDWFADHRHDGWATCPLTENAVVRVLANLKYSPVAEPPAQIVRRLRTFCASGDHTFWPDDISLREEHWLSAETPVSHGQVTDIYLLALARHHAGRLATFDQGIPIAASPGASADDLMVIGAVNDPVS
jgi:hypothetical protein